MPKKIQDLIDGYHRFKISYFGRNPSLYSDLSTQGQRPKTAMIACSDSRVDPAIVLDCEPGDLFVIRNVANLVPPCEYDSSYHGTSAALEFAVCHLEVENIIIFGHTQCGGIHSMLSHPSQKERIFISKWMQLAESACRATQAEIPSHQINVQVEHCAKLAIIHSIDNLKSFPWIHQRIQEQKISLHGWLFHLETGDLSRYNDQTQKFTIL